MTAGSWSSNGAPGAGRPAAEPAYAVLLAAYGGPERLEDVEPYLRAVRGGRPAPPELVLAVRRRYAAIGGRSPLLERTEAQARALALALGPGAAVHVGMRHWRPWIADALRRIAAGGQARVVALPLAPHYSRLSVGAYADAIDAARGGLEVTLVPEWHDHPGFLDAVAQRVAEGLARFAPALRDRVTVLFTAHSLPARILDQGDPYPDRLRSSVEGVCHRLHLSRTRFAYQSAGHGAEPWLKPDAAGVLTELARAGTREVLLCPIGFVSDHLEILFDVDLELQALARRLGLRLERTASLNDSPALIGALADLVRRAAGAAGWA